MKIGITGASGQLGRLIVEELKKKTDASSLVALVRTPEKAAGLGVEVRAFDYSQPKGLVEALKGIDVLMLVSGNEMGKRFEQHSHVIEAAKTAGVKWIVYSSLLKANSSSLLLLSGEHLATEEALQQSGLPYTILRNGWYYENFSNSIMGAVAHNIIMGSAGDGRISAATRLDFAKAAANVLTSSGHEDKTYELAGDNSFSMSELAVELAKQSGKAVEYKNMPKEDYADALVSMGVDPGYAQFFAAADVSISKGDLQEDGRQLSKLMGEPTTSLSSAVAAILAQAQ
ncbi:MAG: SDR family oxidoreductase [Bacteroidota bacterium]